MTKFNSLVLIALAMITVTQNSLPPTPENTLPPSYSD